MKNYFYYDASMSYPNYAPYMPDKIYPEYPYQDINIINNSAENNLVYDNIRKMFIELELDKNNVGSADWNPLGEFIVPGQIVLLKPNLVKHINYAEDDLSRGMDCMVTHPSTVRCFFDYVFVALKGRGKIIIADSPVQGCDFEQLKNNTGYGELFRYLEQKQTDQLEIRISDLREVVYVKENGAETQKELKHPDWESHIIDLGNKSYFNDLKCKSRVRVTCYDGKETVKHHTGGINEYKISDAVLKADVIISISKPKTHRIAGYTGALKNMIGVNSRKEYLPHHLKGAKGKNGDEYNDSFGLLKWASSSGNDARNWAIRYGHNTLASWCEKFCHFIDQRLDRYEPDRKKFGMWYGNDTIWRTILDVNNIVYYADKQGEVKNNIQRRILHVGDMVICGDHEGPLNPTYKKVGGILFSDNPLVFDLFVVKIMGFDWEKIPLLYNAVRNRKEKISEINCKISETLMNSNDAHYNKRICEICKDDTFNFVPTKGWIEHLADKQ